MRLNSIMIYYQLSKRFKINHAQYSQRYPVGRLCFMSHLSIQRGEPSLWTQRMLYTVSIDLQAAFS